METMKKVCLAERAEAYFDKVKAEQKAQAVAYVVETAIPHLTALADRGQRFAVLAYPSSLNPHDVIDALVARVECDARKTNIKPRLEVTW